MLLASIIMTIIVLLTLQLRDRHSSYHLELNYNTETPSQIVAGFSALTITPTITDTWTDSNENAVFDKGEPWSDVNDNGRFDAVWIAGFQNNRPAQGIHDDLWARTMVMQIGDFTFSWTVLDLIGYSNDHIISIRKEIQKQVPVDYSIVASTHTHEGPDVLGMWGPNHYKTGIDKDYTAFINRQVVDSVKEAYENRKPASVTFSEDKKGAAYLVEDSRPPTVIDPSVKLMHVQNVDQDSTLGTLVYWSNHPETTWDKNLLISSDFPHYLRQGVEQGVYFDQDSIAVKGVGGICIFANGSIGGLMTSSPDFPIADHFSDSLYLEPTFDKARIQGEALAMLSLQAMGMENEPISQSTISARANSFDLPLDNSLYRLAASIGIFDRGLTGWWKMRTEVGYISFGSAEFLFHPAEIYPEIVIGGIENPSGADLAPEIIESPPLISFMNKRFRFVCGLSNDMIGYVIPSSQWDKEAPFTYDATHAHYGEINSCGPQSGPILYTELFSLLTTD